MNPLTTDGDNPSQGLFSFHGWLAPGVRLFRGLSFPSKSAWLIGTLLIPICGLTYMLYRANAETIEIASMERQGLVYVGAVNTLLQDLSELRRASVDGAGDLPEVQKRVNAAWSQVQQRQAEFGAAFGGETNDEYAQLDKGLQALLQTPVGPSPDATFASHTQVVDAAIALLGSIGDGSQLALDPQLDTYHAMNVVVVVGPQYAEYLARIRQLGVLALQGGAGKPLAPELRRSVERYLTLISYVDPMYEASYGKGIVAYPEVARTMDMAGVDSAREAFLALVSTQLLADAVNGERAAYEAAAKAAIDKQLRINQQVAKRLDERLQERIDITQHKILLEFAIPMVFFSLTLYLMLAFYRVMRGGLQLVSRHLNELAEGDLRFRPIEPRGKDEPAMLILDLHKVYDSMRELIRRVRHSARELAITSAEVSRASLDLSQRTEDAASNLGEQASAVADIGEQAKNSAQRTLEAAIMAQGNATVAEDGGNIINSVTQTMRNIQDSSKRIGDIIGVIDGIAFQTNILALNAAVEAARAGEQGRGFAVVATEVRALAGRSAAAAKEIKALITSSVEQISAGADVVEGAGRNIGELVANAKQINFFLSDISAGTSSQATRVEQIAGAISELDAHTQQNAALVEQTSASAESLSNQADKLTQEIARFRVS